MSSSGGRGVRAGIAVALSVTALLLAGACSGGDDAGGRDGTVSAGSGGDGEGEVTDDGKRREIVSGRNGPAAAGEIVAKSAGEWQEKWAATGATQSTPDVSAVDFSTEVVVGIFAGEKPTGGWRIDPDVNVRIQGRFAAVSYEVVGPGEGCLTTQAITSPYLVLAVKGEQVRFERSERLEPCD